MRHEYRERVSDVISHEIVCRQHADVKRDIAMDNVTHETTR